MNSKKIRIESNIDKDSFIDSYILSGKLVDTFTNKPVKLGELITLHGVIQTVNKSNSHKTITGDIHCLGNNLVDSPDELTAMNYATVNDSAETLDQLTNQHYLYNKIYGVLEFNESEKIKITLVEASTCSQINYSLKANEYNLLKK